MGVQIIVVGAAGRMGQAICRAAVLNDVDVVAAIVRDGSSMVGRDAFQAVHNDKVLPMSADLQSALRVYADAVVVDFASSATLQERLMVYQTFQHAILIGSTGLGEDVFEHVYALGEDRAVLHSSNTSLGANWLMHLAEETARAFPNAQIDIQETHHRRKVDAPSGTALKLKSAIDNGRGIFHAIISDRNGQARAETHHDIGMNSIRAGETIGYHEVNINLGNEVLTLSHRAEDRALFAEGALHCARFLGAATPGNYKMRDVLSRKG